MEKMRRFISAWTDVMEIVFAVIAGLALMVSFVRFLPELGSLFSAPSPAGRLYALMEELLIFVVGIEFIKMLCKPSISNIIEVLLFLLARHMILDAHSAVDNLLTVLSIGFLFVLEKYLRHGRFLGFQDKITHLTSEDEE